MGMGAGQCSILILKDMVLGIIHVVSSLLTMEMAIVDPRAIKMAANQARENTNQSPNITAIATRIPVVMVIIPIMLIKEIPTASRSIMDMGLILTQVVPIVI